jgi:hypothetical protein
MATFRLVSRPASSIVTVEFNSYNEAAAYIKNKMSATTASVVRPYRKNPAQSASVWAVSYVAGNVTTAAVYERVAMPHDVRVLREEWMGKKAPQGFTMARKAAKGKPMPVGGADGEKPRKKMLAKLQEVAA